MRLKEGTLSGVGGVGGVAYSEVRPSECGPFLVRPRGVCEQFEDVEGVGWA
jgi:hypothetical protein